MMILKMIHVIILEDEQWWWMLLKNSVCDDGDLGDNDGGDEGDTLQRQQ